MVNIGNYENQLIDKSAQLHYKVRLHITTKF